LESGFSKKGLGLRERKGGKRNRGLDQNKYFHGGGTKRKLPFFYSRVAKKRRFLFEPDRGKGSRLRGRVSRRN